MKALAPLLRLAGIRGEAGYFTTVGPFLGVSYGGGLLIGEARTGVVSPRQVFVSCIFMSFAHSVIEDTLIVTALGADVGGVLVGLPVFFEPSPTRPSLRGHSENQIRSRKADDDASRNDGNRLGVRFSRSPYECQQFKDCGWKPPVRCRPHFDQRNQKLRKAEANMSSRSVLAGSHKISCGTQ